MSAAVTVNAAPTGGQKAGQTVTISLSGHSATTTYIVQVSEPNGYMWAQPVTTSGAGAATITYVPFSAGKHTVNTVLSVPTVAATVSFQSGGAA